MLAPVIEAIANDHAGEIKVCKADVDENGELAEKYGISSIPTVLLFKNGEPVKRSVGSKSRGEMEKFIAG
jgi:thioredoxin 1